MEEVGIEMREGRKRRKVKESVGRCEGERRVTTRQTMAERGEGPREGRERVVVRGIVSGSHLAFKSEKGRLKAYGHGRRVYEAGHGFQPQKCRCTAGVTPSPNWLNIPDLMSPGRSINVPRCPTSVATTGSGMAARRDGTSDHHNL